MSKLYTVTLTENLHIKYQADATYNIIQPMYNDHLHNLQLTTFLVDSSSALTESQITPVSIDYSTEDFSAQWKPRELLSQILLVTVDDSTYTNSSQIISSVSRR